MGLVPYGGGDLDAQMADDDLTAHWSVHYGEDDAIAFVVGSVRRDLERLAGEESS